MNDQQLIDRAAARQAQQRAATGAKPLTDDEGGALAVPGLLWADPLRKYAGWQPPEWVPPADPRELARRKHADELKAEAVAAIDQGLIAAARQAMDASAAALQALRVLEAEKLNLIEPLTEQQVLRSLVIDRRIEAARDLASQAQSAVDPALAALRQALSDAFVAIRTRETLIARKMDQQAEAIHIASGDIRLSVVHARSGLENYLPPEAPTVVEPAAPVRRKRLFERNQ